MQQPQLDRNEQIGIVLCSVAVIALIFLGMYIYAGPRKTYAKSRADLTGAVEQLATLQSLKQAEEARLQRQQKLMDILKSRPQGFSLFSFVDKTINDLELRQFATASNAPRRGDARDNGKLDVVSLKLQGVGLKQIMDVLHALYASNNLIVVQRMDRLAPSQAGKGMDCDLMIASLKT